MAQEAVDVCLGVLKENNKRRFETYVQKLACNGENGKKSPASDELNWMPKVARWRLAILAKIDRGLAIVTENVQVPWRLAIRNSVLITSHITFRASIFSDNLSRNSCMYVTEGSKSLTVSF